MVFSSQRVESPQKRVSVVLDTVEGDLTYRVAVQKQVTVGPSPLGIRIDGQNLGDSATLQTPTLRGFSETYPVLGGHSKATNAYNEAIFPIQSGTNKTPWFLEVRVFDDGAAFRYRVPMQGTHTINGETTGWKLPKSSVVWFQTSTNTYESAYQEQIASYLTPDKIIAAPLVAKLPNGLGYAFLSEANLVNYSDMALRVGEAGRVSAIFPHDKNGWQNEGEVVSPWRVVLLTPDLNGLVSSDILQNLCPPPAPELIDAPWIKPGQSTWHWLVTGRPQLATQNKWVDLTKKIGFPYYLIDDGWVDWRDGEKTAWDCMKTVVEYAHLQNVQIWAWVNSKEVFKPEDRAAYFQKAKNAGVVGLKIDFPQSPNVEWVNWYDAVLRDAAPFHLMIDFHGAVKPTGRERTYPHEMTREAVLGRESGKLPALHDAALPFTRYVQGHADFTPTDFRTGRLNGASWAHELAQAVVYTSPFLCYGGSPQNYLDNSALPLLQSIPPTWDETRVLPGSEIGRTAGFARRKGDIWFVGVIEGGDAKPFPIKLDFLGDGAYRAEIFADAPDNNAAWDQAAKTVTNRDTVSPDLRSNGGFVARFTKIAP